MTTKRKTDFKLLSLWNHTCQTRNLEYPLFSAEAPLAPSAIVRIFTEGMSLTAEIGKLFSKTLQAVPTLFEFQPDVVFRSISHVRLSQDCPSQTFWTYHQISRCFQSDSPSLRSCFGHNTLTSRSSRVSYALQTQTEASKTGSERASACSTRPANWHSSADDWASPWLA